MLKPPMHITDSGVALIQAFESCEQVAYQDSGGVWTIGWGETGPDVCEGMVWTRPYCDKRFRQRLASVEDDVNRWAQVPLTQGEFDALVSFTYNCGYAPTLWKLLNAGDYEGAAHQFERWDQVHGEHLAGLLRRRIAEENEFKSTGAA